MRRLGFAGLLAVCIPALVASPSSAQVKFGEKAPELAAGLFTDGRPYSLSDFSGKVVVLYFFEPK